MKLQLLCAILAMAQPALAEEGPSDAAPVKKKNDESIYVLQQRNYSKKGQFEVTPMFYTAVNPKFVGYVGASLSAAYHVRENLAFELTSAVPYLSRAYYSDLVYEVYQYEKLTPEEVDLKQMNYFATASLQFSALYGKFDFYDQPMDYDFYVTAGFGYAQTLETCVPNRGDCSKEVDVGRGLRRPSKSSDAHKALGNLGAGMRLFFSDSIGLRIEVRDMAYADRNVKTGQTSTDIRNNLLMFMGLSFLI